MLRKKKFVLISEEVRYKIKKRMKEELGETYRCKS